MDKGVLVAHGGADHEAGLAAPAGGNDVRLRQWVASRIRDQEVLAAWRPSPEGLSRLERGLNVTFCIFLCVIVVPFCVLGFIFGNSMENFHDSSGPGNSSPGNSSPGIGNSCVGLLDCPGFLICEAGKCKVRDVPGKSQVSEPGIPIFIFTFFPLIFAVLVITCCCCATSNTVAAKKAEVYIVTRSGVVVLTDDYSPPCLCACTTGVDHQLVPWSQVLTVSVDNAGTGCSCVQVPSVSIMLPGVHATGSAEHRRYVQNRSVWLVDEPVQVAAYLQRCKAQFEFHPMALAMSNTMAPMMMQRGDAPMMPTMPVAQVADMRVFCTLAGDPSRTGVIAVAPNMSIAQIAALAGKELGVRSDGATLLLSKNGKSFPITSAATLAPNDEIVLKAH
jgi:hypothetical protein